MPWVQLDDQIASHPKILKAGPDAAWFWLAAIAFCQNHLTDGHVTLEAVDNMPGFRKRNPRQLADRLVEARKPGGEHGLFERRGEDYAVHDYLAHQPSKAVVLERRAKAAARKAKERAKKDVEHGVTA